jgi:nucleotide-binding universal stress UspA family protein
VFSAVAACALASLVSAAPGVARADTTVIVLGQRSIEGDDEVARNVTGALRRAAEQVPGFRVSDRDVSLAQVAVAFGCGDEPDAACLAEIAGELRVQRIVYGTVRRTSAGANYNFALSLASFDAQSGQIDQQTTATVQRVRSDIDDLRAPARQWMSILAGQPQVGTVRVTANVEGAEVLVDGESRGRVSAGRATIGDVPPGSHLLEVAAPEHVTFRQRIEVNVGQETAVTAQLVEGDDPEPPGGGGEGSGRSSGGGGLRPTFWIGVGLTALGVVSLAMTGVAWSTIDGVGSDADWMAYRMAAPAPGIEGGVQDICTPAESGVTYGLDAGRVSRVADLCTKADTWEMLQYVFLGLGVVGVSAGVVLMLSGMGSGEAEAQARTPAAPRLTLAPSFRRDGAGLGATLRF